LTTGLNGNKMNIEEIATHLKFWEDAKPDQMNLDKTIRWLATSNAWRERICAMIIEQNFTNIYDAGAGVGIMATLLKNVDIEAYNFNYKGIDITPKFVNVCQNLGFKVSLGDISDIDEPDNTYDCVLALDVLNHQMDFKKPLSELIRISNKLVYVSFFKEFKEPSEIVYKYKEPPLIYHHFNKQEVIDYLNTFDNIKFSFHHAGRLSRGQPAHTWYKLANSPIPKECMIVFHEEKEVPPAILPHEDLLIIKTRKK